MNLIVTAIIVKLHTYIHTHRQCIYPSSISASKTYLTVYVLQQNLLQSETRTAAHDVSSTWKAFKVLSSYLIGQFCFLGTCDWYILLNYFFFYFVLKV